MENLKKIKCSCGQNFEGEEFKEHLLQCEEIKIQFKEFDIQFGNLLKINTQKKENLLIVKFLLEEYIAAINKKIKTKEITCHQCKISINFTYLSCAHPICFQCFHKLAEKDFYGMKCGICGNEIEYIYKEKILGKEECNNLEKIAILKNNNFSINQNTVECPKCKEIFCFEKGKIDYEVKDEGQNIISKQSAEDYAEHRCRCPISNCNTIFCVNCKEVPYHLGYTCLEFEHIKKALKCRFCGEEMNKKNKGASIDVCNKEECLERYEYCCKKILKCGHKCNGVNGEKICPPCLDEKCPSYKTEFNQNKDSYCGICYIEGLGSAPIVVLSCGHYVHFHCLKRRLDEKWLGPKISFKHCLCPNCNNWFDCKSVKEIQTRINENKKLYEEIKELSLKRLHIEGLDKDERLKDPNSVWYNNKIEFAMKRLSYYMCFKCKKPYFAGRRECGDGQDLNDDDPNKKHNPEDWVCSKCSNLQNNVLGFSDCPKHGKEFIEYKCKFCCNKASWFCWGTTHFCDDCHKRQCNGDYISRYPKEALSLCDPKNCESGGNHPPNGEEFALGCSICKNIK